MVRLIRDIKYYVLFIPHACALIAVESNGEALFGNYQLQEMNKTTPTTENIPKVLETLNEGENM